MQEATDGGDAKAQISRAECADAAQLAHPQSGQRIRRRWKDIEWNEVIQGTGTANRIFMRSGLVRKDLIGQFGQHHCPPTLCLAGRSPEEIRLWCEKVARSFENANEHDGNKNDQRDSDNDNKNGFFRHWFVLKFAASSNAHGIQFIDASSEHGVHVAASYSAASSGRTVLIQKYVPPMLIDGRKFHVRCLVLCVGMLDVFMHENLRVLLAPVRLDPRLPIDEADMHAHVTNRSFNTDHPLYDEQQCNLAFVQAFAEGTREELLRQIRVIVKHLFAQLSTSRRHFFPLPNCFELFGLDFCVDASRRVWLLEANPDPVLALHDTTYEQLLPSSPFERSPPAPNFDLVYTASA